MRFIDLSTFRPENYWVEESVRHTNIILGMDPIIRSAYINESVNKYWNEPVFLDSLKEHGKRKCWYSEAYREVQLFVDHFRPKLKVTKITGSYSYAEAGTRPLHSGYYWLTYNYNNFRICNNLSNKRKGGYFPLKTGSASVEIFPTGDITSEIFMLLDPCVETDSELLMYNLIEPKPTFELSTDETNFHRASISIMSYDLTNSLLTTLRKKTFQMCSSLLEEAENAFTINDEAKLSVNCSKLLDMLSPEAEFSIMIKHRLIGLNHTWLETYVLQNARELNYI